MEKTLVLGLGNDILCDDAVGIFVAEELKRIVPSSGGLDIQATCEMGMALLDYFEGYSSCILIDSVFTGMAPPGALSEFSEGDLCAIHGAAPHFLGVREVLALGRVLGLEMPHRVKIYAIEVRDPYTVGTDLSEEVRDAIPSIIARIREEIERLTP